MATSHSSPVLVQHHINPVPTLDTLPLDINIRTLPTMPSEATRELPPATEIQLADPVPESDRPEPTEISLTTEVRSASPIIPPVMPADESQSQLTQPPLEQSLPSSTEDTTPPPEFSSPSPPETQSDQPSADSQPSAPEPAPPPPAQPDYPEWVTWEEDTSRPSDEELQGSPEDSALDVPKMEQKMYEEWDDPEQRPVKKLRLSWVIKGIRGTKERPNMARVMNSPTALVDGHYWQIKFFPRGNKASSLSAYIRCTKTPPVPDAEVPENTFTYFEGPPDANMGEGAEPKKVVHIAATPKKEEKVDAATQSDEPGASGDNNAPPAADTPPMTDADNEFPTGSEEVTTEPPSDDDYRVSAQLGMVIYNPEEPRTHSFNSSEHQFTRHNDDWGWTNFVGPWNEIHKRTRGQHSALLRDDTLAIDAYIRIFDDKTQALWWHTSHEHESNWPSKKLAGYYPMGTPPLYHSPAVAGITAFLLLAPFREILQTVDAGAWRTNTQIKPRPLIARLQIVLHFMRYLEKEDYVNVNSVIDALKESGETFTDVKSFWEVFRRSIEIELEGDSEALKRISNIFDTHGGYIPAPTLPIKGHDDVQSAMNAISLPENFEHSPPDFLPLMLEREIFDKNTCEWKLCYDRLIMNDEVVFSGNQRYVLYGFMVHVGARNSSKFYAVLRPNGLGSKWLAFEDGEGNKVLSYTRKKIQEYEGLQGDDLKTFKSTRQTAYMVMYIKSSCAQKYVPGQLEEYRVPEWLSPLVIQVPDNHEPQHQSLNQELEKSDRRGIDVEIYCDQGMTGRRGLLDMYNVKRQCVAQDHFFNFRLFTNTTFRELRTSLASQLSIDNVEKLRLFVMSYGEVGQYSSAQWEAVSLAQKISQASIRRPICLWLSVLRSDDDVARFGVPDPVFQRVQRQRKPADGTLTLSLEQVLAESQPVESTTGVAATAEVGEAGIDDSSNHFVVQPASNDTQQRSPPVAPESDTTPPPVALVASTEDDTSAARSTPANEVSRREGSTEIANSATQNGDVIAAPEGLATTAILTQGQTQATLSSDSHGDVASASVVLETPAVQTQESSTQGSEDNAPARALLATPANQPQESSNNPEVSSDPSDDNANAPALTPLATPAAQAQETATEQAVPEAHTSAAESDTAPNIPVPEEPLPVEHGHLIDAVMRDAPPIPPASAATVIDEAIASVRAAQAETETHDQEATSDPIPEPVSPARPVPNFYGFLQVFDAEKQDFFVECTFFAKRDESAKEVVRRCMGWDADKEFNVWHREFTLDGSSIDGKATFHDFNDGVDIIVGEILSEAKTHELRQQGKFSSPFALSQFLRMSERKHPILSRTSTEPVEIADFGMNYYNGPLVNGKPHGENCMVITSHGHTYEGPLIMNEKEGSKGKMTYQNGDIYEGAWERDERHGQGEFVEKRTGNKYIGGWQNGKRWGKGVTHWQVADDEADMCQICYGEEIDAMFFDCGHVCSCVECAKQCDSCPICRETVKQVVRMFWA